MTGTQINDDIRVGIPEDAADYYTAVAILRYMNNAILTIFGMMPNDALIASGTAGSLGVSTSLSVIGAVSSVALPADFGRFLSAHITYGTTQTANRARLYQHAQIPSTSLAATDLRSLGITYDSPVCWLAGVDLHFRPINASGNGSIELHYIKVPTAMTALSDTVPLPVELHPLVAPHCIAQAKYRERNYVEASEMFNLWQARADAYARRIFGRHGAENTGLSTVLPIP
jgi:hypothetical protein